MIAKSISAVALCLAGAVCLSSQEPIVKSQSVTGTATIQAIDSTSRTITLRDQSGTEDSYTVGPEVQRFDEFKVGDTVRMTYYESLVLQVRKAGEKPVGTTFDATLDRAKSALPAGTLAAQAKMTVTVKSIDATVPSVTVTTPDGRTVTRKVEDKKTIEGLAAGDLIDITYTRALVTALERK